MVGAEQAMIDGWIASKLIGASVLDDIFTGLSQRVYNMFAPAFTGFPFIIFQAQSPPAVVRGVGSAEVMVDTIYVVKAIAQGTSYAALAPIASAIRFMLVTNNGETTSNGDEIISCSYERQFALTEVSEAKQFRHLGCELRIQARAA